MARVGDDDADLGGAYFLEGSFSDDIRMKTYIYVLIENQWLTRSIVAISIVKGRPSVVGSTQTVESFLFHCQHDPLTDHNSVERHRYARNTVQDQCLRAGRIRKSAQDCHFQFCRNP